MNRTLKTLPCVLFAFAIAQYVEAGPVEMPLEAQLDLASDVVVGRITKIVPVEENVGDGSHGGRITVEVRETLKGRPAKTLQCLGVTSLDPDWGGGQHYHGYQVGEDGIWLIANGWAPRGGCLPMDMKAEVATALKNLKERKWSPPVNGLRAWAAVTESVIIFAVKNDSNVDLFVPFETETGFVVATVTDERQIPTGLVFLPNGSRSEAVSCRKLSAGQTVYLHPRYSSIDLRWNPRLAPGKYSVVMSCRNDRTKGEATSNVPGSSVSVTPWKGEVSAPALELTISPDRAKVVKPIKTDSKQK